MFNCVRCNQELSDDSNFCNKCGFPVGKIRTLRSCRECGSSVSAIDKFCAQCGKPIVQVQANNGINILSQSEVSKTANDKNPKMILIHGGQFMMGSLTSNTQITLNSFHISETPVTQKQYFHVMGKNPSKLQGENHPVEMVNWCEAIIFCNTLSVLNKLTPCYSIGAATDLSGFDPASPVWKRISCNFTANGFRLPTEAEWEFAARGGKNQALLQYSGDSDINKVAWYGENSNITTHDVGTKSANSLALYDMSGNVAEWCWDYYEQDLPYGPQTNPHGPAIGNMHVKRGGSWLDDAEQCTVFYRSGSSPNARSSSLGFRICRTELGTQI
ncbi:SUMF1/EgtB/PvdO family nonheme iron enzyme [Treponema sp.]|uniref:SUMF1/EgtB/PvdO family nonheme iron enzyme n=1 Tax=Treponema sp. TaxID=166 RepID=UPI00388E0DAD